MKQKITNNSAPKPLKERIVMPYIPAVSDRIGNVFRKLNLQPVFIPCRKLASMFSHKYKDRLEEASGVYSVPCTGCSSCYIGETGRKFSTRMKEHKSDVRLRKVGTALSEHALSTGHSFDFDHLTILYKESCWPRRTFLEAWGIAVNKIYGSVCTNFSSGKTTIPETYRALFSRAQRRPTRQQANQPDDTNETESQLTCHSVTSNDP
jgi:hypothetical protein